LQCAGLERGFDCPPLAREVAAAVRGDGLAAGAGETRRAGLPSHVFRGSTGSDERERLLSFGHEAAKEHRDVGVGRLGRLPEDDVASPAGRPVGGDRHDVLARLSDQSAHHLGGIDGCCRGTDERGRRPIPSAQPAQSPEHERDVGTEDSAVAVRLVDDDVPQATQEG